jgi:LacI family transcriptional regulator
MRSVLEARGIRGLLCLGALEPDEHFPEELTGFALVMYATSVPKPLHRVVSHFSDDARTVCEQLLRRSYARPGLIILQSGDRRSDYLYSAVFLSHQERKFASPAIPILRAEAWDEREFACWFEKHRPDALVLHPYTPYLNEVEGFLRRQKIVVPRDLGLVVLDKIPDRTRYTGILQDHRRMGAVAIEMLIGRLLLQDFGIPRSPKIELVDGIWVEGRTLRRPVKGLAVVES